MHLRRLAEDLTSRYYVVSRETLFQSPVALTPYQSEERIDDAKLGAIIDDAYDAAKLHPDNIDTGVVILTGEALRRENAQGIAAILSEQGGEFVTATAGHHMESMLAAYGSGAARVSSDEGKRILNIDIGGGTTKLALVEKGKVIATAAVHIGGRLQVVENGKIVRLDPAGKHHAKRAGFSWNRGDTIDPADMQKVADVMADTLVAALTARPHAARCRAPLSDRSDRRSRPHRRHHVFRRRRRIRLSARGSRFRRHGPALGRAIRARIDARRVSVAGAAGRRMHPRHRARRLRIQRAALRQYQLHFGAGHAVAAPQSAGAAAAVRLRRDDRSGKARRRDPQPYRGVRSCGQRPRDRACACAGPACRRTSGLLAFAEGIKRGLADRFAKKQPVFIMLDGDVAQTLGHILRDELQVESELLVIDGVVLWDFDYIDLGRIRMPSYTVPVTIKSLVFSEDPRGPRPRQRLHHHEHDHDHAHGHDARSSP